MKLTKTQISVGSITLITAILAVVTNFATADKPPWLSLLTPYLWPILLLLIVALVVISIRSAAPDKLDVALDSSKLDRIVGLVSNAEQLKGIDPTLDRVERWAEKLEEWKETAVDLQKMAGIDVANVQAQPKKLLEQPHKLLIRLAQATLQSFSHYGKQEDVIYIAKCAYIAALRLSDTSVAAHMAYVVAQRLYQQQQYSESSDWTLKMQQHVDSPNQTANQSDLKLMLAEMKGLIERDYTGNKQLAEKYLDEALEITTRSGDNYKKARILTHIAIIKELNGQLSEALNMYTSALQTMANHENPDFTLECYDKLTRLSVALGQDVNAYNFAKDQLSLAKLSLRRYYESRAHERIGWHLFKCGNYKEAYNHAKQALLIEEESNSDRINSMRAFVITIADRALE